MTPAGEKIAAEIRESGPILFSRFMEIALYDAHCGYYSSRTADPFGKHGDFFTAAQLQPVFGRLVAAAIRRIRDEMRMDDDFTVVDWGAGRAEMREALREFNYVAMDSTYGAAPPRINGVIFANELFDALPVDVARRTSGGWRALRVDANGDRFVWREGEIVASVPFAIDGDDDVTVELPVKMPDVIRDMANRLESGAVIVIDYGITERERIRFPEGTLMSYRRHRAIADVLDRPGEQDITSHVPFDLLNRAANECGFSVDSLQSMSGWLMSLGEGVFEAALVAASEDEASKLRLQLKTLLVSMGDSFRVSVWGRA